MKDRHLVSKN